MLTKTAMIALALASLPATAQAARLVSAPFTQSALNPTVADTVWTCSIRYLARRPVLVVLSMRKGVHQVGAGSKLLSAADPVWSYTGGGYCTPDACRDVTCMYKVPGEAADYRASLCMSTVDGALTSCLPAY